jgi:hypothetical protein
MDGLVDVLNGMVWDGHGGGAAREEEERGADEEDAEVDAAQPERQRQGRPRQRVVGAAEHPRPAADVPLYLLLCLPRNGRRPGDRPRPSRRPAAGIPSRRAEAGGRSVAPRPLASGLAWLLLQRHLAPAPRGLLGRPIRRWRWPLHDWARRVFIEDPRCRMRARRRGGAETSACCFPGIEQPTQAAE